MNTNDEVTFEAPVPAKPKKAKVKAKKKVRAAAAPKQQGVPFPGLTRLACADGCNEKGCIISGKSYCAHPTKGGLQAADQSNPTALKRLQQAREQLAVKLDPNRFTTV